MLKMTPQLFSQLETVNLAVNQFQYRTDLQRYNQPEFWARIDAQGGDCDDYALEKRHRLLTLGWPRSSLRLALCRCETGEGHAVLTVDCDRGTFILDNRFGEVKTYRQLVAHGYRFDRRQAAGASHWVKIKE